MPTSTGAAKAIGLVLPRSSSASSTASRCACRSRPGSITDLTVIATKSATADEIKAAYKNAAEGSLKGILEYTEDEIVSSDIVTNPHSAIFDSGLLRVIGNEVKLSAWYDNEWGYSNRLVDLTEYVAERL